MSTLESESLITCAEAAKVYAERTGRRPDASTVWRHCMKGVQTTNGERLFLECLRVGRTVYTSRKAIQRFWQALADASREAHVEARREHAA